VPETVVLLHGFGGTRRAWDGVIERLDAERYRPLALDLPGHGERRHDRAPITFAGSVQDVLARAPERFALCGYSLGGRVAMHVALTAPERVAWLVIVAANPGIEDVVERAARSEADSRMADELESAPFEDFVERWGSQPLFRSDPPRVGELARADQRRNDPLGLATALRGLGTGEMAPLWPRLGELRMPVAFLAGDRDGKFAALGRRLVALVPHGRLIELAGGHRLPLECPDGVAQALEDGP
jgi:2-succinyl-6-hydroxy-2,4-cyclohexadiene-1-carboxylate synthase